MGEGSAVGLRARRKGRERIESKAGGRRYASGWRNGRQERRASGAASACGLSLADWPWPGREDVEIVSCSSSSGLSSYHVCVCMGG